VQHPCLAPFIDTDFRSNVESCTLGLHVKIDTESCTLGLHVNLDIFQQVFGYSAAAEAAAGWFHPARACPRMCAAQHALHTIDPPNLICWTPSTQVLLCLRGSPAGPAAARRTASRRARPRAAARRPAQQSTGSRPESAVRPPWPLHIFRILLVLNQFDCCTL